MLIHEEVRKELQYQVKMKAGKIHRKCVEVSVHDDNNDARSTWEKKGHNQYPDDVGLELGIGGRGAYSFIASPSHLITDHASFFETEHSWGAGNMGGGGGGSVYS